MSLTYLGSATVGEWVPAGLTMQAELLTDLQARLDAQVALVAALTLNPGSFTIAGALTTVQQLVVEIEAQIALGIELPSISLQISVAAAFIATLEAQIALLVQLEIAFGTAGVHGYAFDGAASQLGPELAVALAGGFPGGLPTDHANALVLATTVPAAWAALGVILKTA